MTSVDQFCAARRAALLAALGDTRALIPAGLAPPRNYPGNRYPFRASSHFLFLVGQALPGAVLAFEDGEASLFAPAPDAWDALWHGARPSLTQLGASLGLPVRPLPELASWRARAAFGSVSAMHGTHSLVEAADPTLSDRLQDALVSGRLVHDAGAVDGLREAASVSVAAHRAGLAATRPGSREWHVRAAMEQVLLEHGCGSAYNPIVTVRGDVLHNESHHRTLASGDLLLADVGAETAAGWAGDITRTWPVSGRFSESQRALYDVVAQAQQVAIEAVAPGVRFRDVHLCAARALAEGLCQLGILRGQPSARVLDGSYAAFMPHGIGHLLGLDVHDMEDLGDRAGYAPGFRRDAQFGLCHLRLDRELQAGMAVTIEPGFYRIDALLQAPGHFGIRLDHVDFDRLAQFDDVRGIRIEDDVLVTDGGREVLTAALPKSADEIESLVGAG